MAAMESDTVSDTSRRLADAMRSGLDQRRSLLPPVGHVFCPPQFMPETRRALRSHADLLHFPAIAKPGRFAALVRLVRKVLHVLVRPWLGVQTQFNQLTIESLIAIHREVLALQAHLDQYYSQYYSAIVNRENGPDGRIAEAGLWFNPPIAVQMDGDKAEILSVSERIVEHMFVHTRLPKPPARVLDLGCAESLNAVEMASFGYQVQAVDLRVLRVPHAGLSMIRADIARLPFADASFDAAVSLSTVEHVGLDWYVKNPDGASDFQVVCEAARVLRPGGRFILTVPFGRPAQTDVHRVYDQQRLAALLRPLDRIETLFGLRDGLSWSVTSDADRAAEVDSTGRVSAVAMVVAEKP